MSSPQYETITLEYAEQSGRWIAVDNQRGLRATGQTRREALDWLDEYATSYDDPESEAAAVLELSGTISDRADEHDFSPEDLDEAIAWARSQ